MKRAVIYTRVSTDKQEKEGNSLPEQEKRCRAAIESKGWELVKVYTDTWTGATIDRPGLQELLTDMESGLFDVVVVYKLDRLSRTQKGTMTIIEDFMCKNDIGLLSLSETLDTTTPWGKAMIGILSAFNQLERDNIRQRISMGRQAAKEKGKWTGGSLPTGYKSAGKHGAIGVDEEQAEMVRYIFRRKSEGVTNRGLAEEMQNMGFNGYRGGKMSDMKIHSILKHADAYALGEWHTGGIVIKVPKIIELSDVPFDYRPIPAKDAERKLAEMGVVLD